MRNTRADGSPSGLNQTSAIRSPRNVKAAHCFEGGWSEKITPHPPHPTNKAPTESPARPHVGHLPRRQALGARYHYTNSTPTTRVRDRSAARGSWEEDGDESQPGEAGAAGRRRRGRHVRVRVRHHRD